MFSINYSSTSTEDLDSFFITRADSSSSSETSPTSTPTPTTLVVTASHTVYMTAQQTGTDADADAETDVGAKPPATTNTPSNSTKAAEEVVALLRLVSGSAQKM